MILGVTYADVTEAFAVLDNLGSQLGLKWKISKDERREQPLQQLEFLGMLFDTVRQEMRMSPLKRQLYTDGVHELLGATASVPAARQFLEMTVQRAFLAQACCWGFSFLQGLYDDLFITGRPAPCDVRLLPEARTDLEFCQRYCTPTRPCGKASHAARRPTSAWCRGSFTGPDGAIVFTYANGTGFGAVGKQPSCRGNGRRIGSCMWHG